MRGRLFDLGSYPAMVVDVDASWVKGEIYAVPTDGWEALDALEYVVCALRPDGAYFRVLASALASGGRLRLCHVYVANPEVVRLDRPIENGDWLRHMAWRAG